MVQPCVMFRWVVTYLACCVATASLAQIAPASAPAVSSEAVIQHEFESHIHELLVISALDSEGRKLDGKEAADKLFQATQTALGEGKSVDMAANASLSRDAMALLRYYISNSHEDGNKDKVKVAAQWLASTSAAYGEASKKPLNKAKAQYYNNLARYILSDGAEGISNLVSLQDQLANEKHIAANINLLIGYSLALAPTTSAQGLGFMTRATADVSVNGRVAQRLTEAFVEYGLDADGSPTAAPKATAESKLSYAIQVARGMPKGLQLLVMDTAIFIWSKANTNKAAKAPPFLVEGFHGLIPVEALHEREATTALKAGDLKTASRIYKELSTVFAEQELGLQLDKRVWDIEFANYQKTKQISDLEATYTALVERYPAQKLKKGSDQAFTMIGISESYRKTLEVVLTQAMQAGVIPSAKTAAIEAAVRYVKLEADRATAYPIKVKLAQAYRASNMFKEAVDLNLDLAKDQGLKHYLLAIEAQSRLANWPLQPVFDTAPPGDAAERTRLLGILETVAKLKSGDDWQWLAHMGLLYRALGQNKKSEDLWLNAFKNTPSGKYTGDAAGLLLSDAYATKRWNELVDLAHILAAKKIIPSAKGKALNYAPWLAEALFTAGQADLQAKNFVRAVRYLDEFVQAYGADARAPAATVSLALAYKGAGKLVAALNVTRAIVEKNPKFPQRPQAILQAAEWGLLDKATIEYTFYFYGKYLNDYKTEANIPQIRMTLADLYQKRKLYGWASRLYREQSMATNVSRDQQLAAAVKFMDVEEQFGEAKDAFWGAQRITQLAKPTDPAAIHALAFQARYVSNAKDAKAMNEIEARLNNHSKTSKEATEALGYLRFKRAEMLTRNIVYTENNLLIKDPEAIVKKYFAIFEAEKLHYLRVCQIGVTTSCAPAFLRLTYVAKQGAEALDKVQIADTLGPNRVNSFKVFKQLHLNKILQARRDYGTQALKMAKAGTTTPLWKDEIVKNLEYEDNIGVAH